MKQIIASLSFLFAFSITLFAKGDIATSVMPTIEAQMEQMVENTDNTNKVCYPRTIKNGKIQFVTASDWTKGFFPGSLWYMHALSEEKDGKWATQAARYSEYMTETQYMDAHHDIGFMMFNSFGNGLRLGERSDYIPELIQSAKTLMKRYHPNGGIIQSWGTISKKPNATGKVIIDNMMNLELLFEVSALTGDKTYYNAAVSHANSTMKNHFRENNSSYHVLVYNTSTGDVVKKITAQGWKDESSWARGQAWGLYGFTMCYRYTKDEKYLDQANKIAEYVIAESKKIEDGIYYWDYDYEKAPTTVRDASAAAIVASALYELNVYNPKGGYKKAADRILKSLSSEEYLAKAGENMNFLLKHSTGHFTQNSEVDVPLNYADYYYLEALYRQKAGKNFKPSVSKALEVPKDRRVWLESMEKISRPLLENIAKGTLKKNMPIENGERAVATHLEAVGRLITGIGPWLGSEGGDEYEVKLRKEFQELTIKGLQNCVDPKNPDNLNFKAHHQNYVDAAFLVHGLLRCKGQIWDKLGDSAQKSLLAKLQSMSRPNKGKNNWTLFYAMIEIGIREFGGEKWRQESVEYAINSLDSWYQGDGVYGDGPKFHNDYYNSFVMQPMLSFCVDYMEKNGFPTKLDGKTQRMRHGRYAENQERFISPEGTYPVIGRSICYRFGAFYALSDAAYRHILPSKIKPAQVRSALTAVIKNQINAPSTFNKDGWLRIGFFGSQPTMGETYISTGSLYLCSSVFPALGLPATDPFWSDPFTKWTNLRAWTSGYLGCDKAIKQ